MRLFNSQLFFSVRFRGELSLFSPRAGRAPILTAKGNGCRSFILTC